MPRFFQGLLGFQCIYLCHPALGFCLVCSSLPIFSSTYLGLMAPSIPSDGSTPACPVASVSLPQPLLHRCPYHQSSHCHHLLSVDLYATTAFAFCTALLTAPLLHMGANPISRGVPSHVRFQISCPCSFLDDAGSASLPHSSWCHCIYVDSLWGASAGSVHSSVVSCFAINYLDGQCHKLCDKRSCFSWCSLVVHSVHGVHDHAPIVRHAQWLSSSTTIPPTLGVGLVSN